MSIKSTRQAVGRIAQRLSLNQDWWLVVLGAGIGTVTAFGAVGFAELVGLAERQAHRLHEAYSSWTLLLIPMLGALATGVLVHFFAREAKGHGVPEVMDAVYRRAGRIRPRVALIKSITSATTIGSGGSAGAEGPIVQIGSAIGSAIAQMLGASRDQAGTLLGCGAAAGIASIFNAPIAGVFFVMEIILRDFSLRTFTPIVVAAVFSTAVTQAILGQNVAIFAAGQSLQQYQFTLLELPSYILLGIACGLVATGFTRMLYASEDLAERVRVHPIIKPVIGAMFLGLLGIGFVMIASGEHATVMPPFFGNGYDTIRELLDPITYITPNSGQDSIQGVMDKGAGAVVSGSVLLLLALVIAKSVATCLTLGSGGSGGVFAPSLFIGASTGAAVGVGLQQLGLLPETGSPAAYALVGMAAVVAGATHAPLTAILIIFEVTRDVYVLLPIMLAAVMSTLVARLSSRDSIYTLKLRRRGVLIGSAVDLTLLRRIPAREVPIVPHVSVRAEDTVSKVLDLNRRYQVADFVVVGDNDEYEGIITSQDVRTALLEQEAIPLMIVEDIVVRNLPTVTPDEGLDMVMDKFSRNDVTSLAMVEASPGGGQRVIGLLTRSRLMRRYQQALRES